MDDQTAQFNELRREIADQYSTLLTEERDALLMIGEAVVNGDSTEEITRRKNDALKARAQKAVVAKLVDRADAITRSI